MTDLGPITDAIAIGGIPLWQRIWDFEIMRMRRYNPRWIVVRRAQCLVWDPSRIGERERQIIEATWPEKEAA